MFKETVNRKRDEFVRLSVSRKDFLRLGGAGLAGLALLPLAGCGGAQGGGAQGGGAQSGGGGGVPDPLRIGVIPSEDTENVAAAFEPIAEFVGERLDTTAELYTATDYSGIIEAMRSGEAEVAWLGPLSYVLAADRAKAEAVAVQVTEEGGQKPTYQSYIITRRDSGIESLKDIKGKNFAFVDPTSTSGNLFPRKAFTDAGMNPDKDLGDSTFAGGHDASALAVSKGDVDAGAVASTTYKSMVQEGLLKEDELRMVWESDPIPESPIAVRGDLDKKVKDDIKAAFLDMKPEDLGTEQLSPDGAIGYVAANDSDYDVIRKLAKSLDLDSKTLAG